MSVLVSVEWGGVGVEQDVPLKLQRSTRRKSGDTIDVHSHVRTFKSLNGSVYQPFDDFSGFHFTYVLGKI